VYTSEEQETFRVCIASCAIDELGCRALRALAEAVGDPGDPRGVTTSHVLGALKGRPPRSVLGRVPKVLAKLARHAREDGLPIEVTEDAEGTLWYRLSAEQAGLMQAQLGHRRVPPFF
jgi:hypothetical protein